ELAAVDGRVDAGGAPHLDPGRGLVGRGVAGLDVEDGAGVGGRVDRDPDRERARLGVAQPVLLRPGVLAVDVAEHDREAAGRDVRRGDRVGRQPHSAASRRIWTITSPLIWRTTWSASSRVSSVNPIRLASIRLLAGNGLTSSCSWA